MNKSILATIFLLLQSSVLYAGYIIKERDVTVMLGEKNTIDRIIYVAPNAVRIKDNEQDMILKQVKGDFVIFNINHKSKTYQDTSGMAPLIVSAMLSFADCNTGSCRIRNNFLVRNGLNEKVGKWNTKGFTIK